MRLAPWVAGLCIAAYAQVASAQELAFGSETWRGHAMEIKDAPLACRAFSHFGNGDRLAFVAFMLKGKSEVGLMAFLTPMSSWAGGPASPTSIGPVFDRLKNSPTSAMPIRSWVDDDSGASIQGTVNGRAISFWVGTLDQSAPAKFFHKVRDGNVLHVLVAGQDRRYVLRGTFAALSELVGCALKARDGEVSPSDGMPHREVAVASLPRTAAPPAPKPPVDPTPTIAPVQPVAGSIPQPSRPSRRELTSSGSGIVVTADGHILTNHHVVEGCDSFGLRRVGDAEQRATLLAKDVKNDLALLKAAEPYQEVASFRVEPPRLAETVVVYGFPLSGMLSSSGNVTLGNISALMGLGDDSRDVQISAAVQPGNSGGPMFDGSGLLLGIVQSKLNAIRAASVTGDIAQNVNFAIRGSLATSFLGANGIEPSFKQRRPALPADEIMDRAQKVTVQVLCYGGER